MKGFCLCFWKRWTWWACRWGVPSPPKLWNILIKTLSFLTRTEPQFSASRTEGSRQPKPTLVWWHSWRWSQEAKKRVPRNYYPVRSAVHLTNRESEVWRAEDHQCNENGAEDCIKQIMEFISKQSRRKLLITCDYTFNLFPRAFSWKKILEKFIAYYVLHKLWVGHSLPWLSRVWT